MTSVQRTDLPINRSPHTTAVGTPSSPGVLSRRASFRSTEEAGTGITDNVAVSVREAMAGMVSGGEPERRTVAFADTHPPPGSGAATPNPTHSRGGSRIAQLVNQNKQVESDVVAQ